MKKAMPKYFFVLAGSFLGLALLIRFDGIGTGSGIEIIKNAAAGTLSQAQVSQAQVKDQMVCHVGKIRTVLNKNYSTKSLSCMKRSTQTSQNYNNLAEIYAEGWIVVDINNANTWVFNK